MFPSLRNALEGCKATLEEGHFHTIAETPYLSANAFVIYYLMNTIKERNVCFLSLQNSWSHYCNICNRLGVNLRSKFMDGVIETIEAMKIIPTLFGSEQLNELSFVIEEREYPLKYLYLSVKRIVNRLKQTGKPIAIIIDSVSPLLNLGVSVKEIDVFVQYCKNLLIPGRDVFIVSCSVDEIDLKSILLYNRLNHKSSVSLSVSSLSTGNSKNIHGQLIVSTTQENFYHKGQRNLNKFHYKVEERDIKVFSVGLASKTL